MSDDLQRSINTASRNVVKSRIFHKDGRVSVDRNAIYDLWWNLYRTSAVDYGFSKGADGVSEKAVEASTRSNKES